MNARKPQPRNAAKGTWQGRWDRVDITGQWTNVRTCINCGHRRLDYYLTQVLSGHEVFRAYALRFKND